VVLSACSNFFQKLLDENPCKHPIIIMPPEIAFVDLQFIIEFVYRGEIDVSEPELQVSKFSNALKTLKMRVEYAHMCKRLKKIKNHM
jgi:hypothetical protein